jgi:hypothetical protein
MKLVSMMMKKKSINKYRLLIIRITDDAGKQMCYTARKLFNTTQVLNKRADF